MEVYCEIAAFSSKNSRGLPRRLTVWNRGGLPLKVTIWMFVEWLNGHFSMALLMTNAINLDEKRFVEMK
jgi:hypothetical protein